MTHVCKAVLTAKWTRFRCRMKKTGGTALPGIRAENICPDILSRTSRNVITILVSGTNGKSTTVRMILHLLKHQHLDCLSNSEGANIGIGITTAFVVNSSLSGKARRHYAVIECDELYLEKMCRILKPAVLVFTNISSDQRDRLISEENIRGHFLKAMSSCSAAACINTSCPYTDSLISGSHTSRVIPYTVRNGNPAVNGREYPVKLSIPGEYNLLNAAAACAAAEALNILTPEAALSLKDVRAPYGRMEKFKAGPACVTMNLAKNGVGFNLTLQYLEKTGTPCRVFIGINHAVEDGTDPSWLDSVDVEKYPGLFSETYVFGSGAEAVRERLLRAGISRRSVSFLSGPAEVLNRIAGSPQPVFMILNYTCMMTFRAEAARKGYVDDFWKH